MARDNSPRACIERINSIIADMGKLSVATPEYFRLRKKLIDEVDRYNSMVDNAQKAAL